MSVDPNAVRAISWAELKSGRWAARYTDRPCAPGLLAVGRRWPEWQTGTPPTWADFVAAQEIDAADRRWLVARALLRDRRRLAWWAVDCAEAAVRRAGSSAAICTDVIAPLRAWIAGDYSIDIAAVRRRAWKIYAAGADAATFATFAAFASTFDSSSAFAAADAADAAAAFADVDANAMLRLALPHLAALESRP